MHSIHVDGENGVQPNTKKEMVELTAKTNTMQHLTEKVEMLTKLVDSLTQTVQKDQTCHCSSAKPRVARKNRLYGCSKCVQEGSQDCRHCFSCGELGHRAVGSLKHPKQQENVNRLMPGYKQ